MQNNDGDRAIARHDRTAAAPALALFVLHAKHRIAGMEHEIISAIVGSLSLSLFVYRFLPNGGKIQDPADSSLCSLKQWKL
jgi:hypothetical protein